MISLFVNDVTRSLELLRLSPVGQFFSFKCKSFSRLNVSDSDICGHWSKK